MSLARGTSMSAPNCQSDIHLNDPAPATTCGTYRWFGAQRSNVWYCDRCARSLRSLGLFIPDATP